MADNMPRPSGSSGREASNAEREDKMHSGAGFREVVQTLVSTNFPVERAELEEQVGDERVEIEKGRTVSVREIIRILPSERFETDVEFRKALEENWEEIKGLPSETAERKTKKPSTKRKSSKRTTTKKTATTRAPKVNRGRTTNRNAGTKGSNRSAAKRKGDRGGNERAGGKSGNQRPGGRSRQQRGSKTERAKRQRKQAMGARNKRTRGRRTGAVPGRSRSR